MTGHLPECYKEGSTDTCICDELRACEQRVRQDVIRENGDWIQMPTAALDQIKQFSHAAGLDAAREAVERVSSLLQPLGPALAAIDALREEQK